MTFPGASWWKVDIHTHTPASTDFGKMAPDIDELRATTPSAWLMAFMAAGIQAVVVTDHNSGVWIDPLKASLAALERDRPAGFTPLTIFPGVEITANGAAHVLAVLPLDATTATVDALLGAIRYHGERGARRCEQRCGGGFADRGRERDHRRRWDPDPRARRRRGQ